MHRTNSMVTVINHLYKPDLTDRSMDEKSSDAFYHAFVSTRDRHFKNTIKTTFSCVDSPSFHFCSATNVGISSCSHKACYVRFARLIAFPLTENNTASNHEIPGKWYFLGRNEGKEGVSS
jgi:hypothetical protein